MLDHVVVPLMNPWYGGLLLAALAIAITAIAWLFGDRDG